MSSSSHPALAERDPATGGEGAGQATDSLLIDVKATIADKQVDKALRRFGVTPDGHQERVTYFFDTPRRALMDAGIILRTRRVAGGTHDATVKVRPILVEQDLGPWSRADGFKLELDASEKGLVRSAALTMPVGDGLIARVRAGEEPISALFSPEQENFLKEMGGMTIDFGTLVTFGPLRAYWWRYDDPRCPWPVMIELWHRVDGARLLEASVRAPEAQAAFATAGFMGLLADVGVRQAADQQSKTRWALSHRAAVGE
jgi:hypothetical protein